MEKTIKDPKVDFEVDDDFNAKLTIHCGYCHTITNIPFQTIPPDTTIKCSGCDYEFKMSGDDLSQLQNQLDDLKRTFDNIGK